MRLSKVFVSAVLLSAVVAAVPGARVTAANDTIPDFEKLLPECPMQSGVPDDPCHLPGDVPDAPGIVIVPCSETRKVTNFCYDATVDGNAAPPTLKIMGYMTAWKMHDATVDNAQLEANIIAYYVPQGATLKKGELWGWGKRPADQANGAGGKVDLSPVLTENSVLKVVVRYKTHRMPQYNVLVANQGTMDFALSGQDLTLTIEGKPARVAIESAAQHIDFDTERSDDTTKPWTDRCGFPSMKFVVCNVDKAESNPLVFYARSSTMANAPAAEVPGPIWVSTNATYFHMPSLAPSAGGNKQIQVKVAAPHLLADGTTVNTGAFRTFLPNGLLTQWGITKTEAGLNRALAATVKKYGKELVVDRTFVISDLGVTITFPNLTYSSDEIYVTQIALTGGAYNANHAMEAMLQGYSHSATTVKKAKSLKQGSSTTLASLIVPAKGYRPVWTVTGNCSITGTKLKALVKKATCALSMKQTNTKSRTVKETVLNIKVT